MNTKNKITDISAEIDELYGKRGTEQRAKFDEEAWNFYSSQILQDARKDAKLTQQELASRTNTTKSYISRVENGSIVPSVGMFYRIIAALGKHVAIV